MIEFVGQADMPDRWLAVSKESVRHDCLTYPLAQISMELDDEVCLCFHVTKRKLLSFLRVEQPRRAGQLSECFGAGTGCGWFEGRRAACVAHAPHGRPHPHRR